MFTFASCDSFLTRDPENEFDAEQFFASETDLEYYTNGLIDTFIPDAADVALGNDKYSDFCGTKESQTFFWPDRYTPEIATGWTASTFSFLRKVAYMLENMPNAKDNVSESTYNHYEGVARFFRAYSTFNKVKTFGDLYWIDHVVGVNDSTILYGPRQDREYIMHNVVEDLAYACDNCLSTGTKVNTTGRIYINKYVALAAASRICLFEGTYRKYHSTNPSTGNPWNGQYESADDLLNLAFKYAGELISANAFSLHSKYGELFTSSNLQTDEVIWGRTYSEALSIKQNVTYSYCSTTSSQLYGPTKEYVMMFLKSDGTPVQSGAVSMTEEFSGRDNRLSACVLSPGQKRKDQSGADINFSPDFTWTTTGYFWMKWIQTDYSSMTSSANASSYSVPLMRYSEVLLDYAEAAAELGKMTQEIWDQTIGQIRKVHGGISNSAYPGTSSYVADSFLRDYYTKDVLHASTLSDTQLEIRRERATELMMEEGTRYDDLMRWNLGDLIERRYNHKGWRGIYVTQAEAANGFDFNGKHYTVSTSKSTSETNYKISAAADKAFTLSNGTYGYLVYNYTLQWDDKMYLHPIPTTAINVNPNLGQNEGWQWN